MKSKRPPASAASVEESTPTNSPKEKSMSPAEQPNSATETDTRQQVLRGGAGNVDKIRDILFGSQMRDYEARFARLEETLVKETVEIRETNRRRFDQLETYICLLYTSPSPRDRQKS